MSKVQMQVTLKEEQIQEAICDYIKRLIPGAVVMDIDYEYEDDNKGRIIDGASITVNIDLPPDTKG